MPRYDYDCTACGRRFEVILGIHDDGPAACALCGSGPVKKAFTPPTIHFKGSGWAKKERRAASASRASRASTDKASTDEASGSASGSSDSEVSKDEGSKVVSDSATVKGDGSKAGSDSSPAKSGGSTREPREPRESTAKGPAPTGGSAAD